jgi:hypothetical protein
MFSRKKNQLSKINNNLKIIKKIEQVRGKNNKNWMDLYRIAFRYAPEESVKITKKILEQDIKISEFVKKLR